MIFQVTFDRVIGSIRPGLAPEVNVQVVLLVGLQKSSTPHHHRDTIDRAVARQPRSDVFRY